MNVTELLNLPTLELLYLQAPYLYLSKLQLGFMIFHFESMLNHMTCVYFKYSISFSGPVIYNH